MIENGITYSNLFWENSALGPIGYDLFTRKLLYLDTNNDLTYTELGLKNWINNNFSLFDEKIPSFANRRFYNDSLAVPPIHWMDRYWNLTVEMDFNFYSLNDYLRIIKEFSLINHVEFLLRIQNLDDLLNFDFEGINSIPYLSFSIRILPLQRVQFPYDNTIKLINNRIALCIKKVYSIVVYNSMKELTIDREENYFDANTMVFVCQDDIRFLEQHKNIVNFFKVFQPWYTVSKRFNLFYYKKVEINKKLKVGYFVDYENMISVSDVSILDKWCEEFYSKLWNVTKDKVDYCRLCPLRYGCFDPRIPHKNENNIYQIKNVSECGITDLFPF